MKYIGFYDTQTGRRSMCFAATNKMNYICKALNQQGFPVEIIACGMIAKEAIPATTEQIYPQTEVQYFKTKKSSRNKLLRIWNVLRQSIVLFWYLVTQIKHNEIVLSYHSLSLMRVMFWAKKVKKFRLVLEVEECYNDVYLRSQASKKMEEKYIASADAYIFATQLLNQKYNQSGKPYVIIHGTYQVEEVKDVSFDDDNKIHVVYAGTFDPRKGGAYAAIEAMQYLPEQYHLHVLGFGSQKEVAEVKALVETMPNASYDGLLSGDAYTEFLQKCHIGLSTQNPEGDFNATSFPSKILSYMANGLRVVTVRIPAVETSAIGADMHFYDRQTPQEIAKAIMQVNLEVGYDSRKRLQELNEMFCNRIKKMMGEI